MWHGLDALLQWQAQAAAQAAAGGYAIEVPAVQTAFLLDLGIKANLQHSTQVCCLTLTNHAQQFLICARPCTSTTFDNSDLSVQTDCQYVALDSLFQMSCNCIRAWWRDTGLVMAQGLEVDMQNRGAAAFAADLETVRAFGVTALGGNVEASSVHVQATGAIPGRSSHYTKTIYKAGNELFHL